MDANGQDHAVLIEAPDWAEVCMAETLLAEAGIPCMRRGTNGALIGGGDEAESMRFKQSLMVPAALLEKARAVLGEAWGDRE